MATIKLEEITTQYRSFVPDQVLTAEQLNTIIDYFEDQNRLTRVCLNGAGIVCGLKIEDTENNSITVSNGCGVTTDGDLIKYDGKTYTHFKLFEDTDAVYSKFDGIQIHELITAEEPDTTDASELNILDNLEDKVVVLYLENYGKEETPCTSTDCDNQGEIQHAKIRILLISKEDVKVISNKSNDPVFNKHNNIKKFIDLPDIKVKRIILNNNYETNREGKNVISQNSNTANYIRLKESYRIQIKESGILDKLKSGVARLFTDFKVLLDTDSLTVNEAEIINSKITTLFNFSFKNVPLDIQYRYDLLKDLVDTFNEIKCLLFDLKDACCPDINSFSKHLLLGELNPSGAYYEYRHSFYPSPIINSGKEKLEEVRNLILRMNYMLEEYKIPESFETEIKVTPSKNCHVALSKRSIPYYYETKEGLVRNWEYDKTKKYEEQYKLGYHRTDESLPDPVRNPLDYTIDSNDFFRIEGHLGKDYRTVIKELDDLKNEKGLPFDIKVLSIDETLESLDISDYKCQFEDLNAVLKAWRAEQNCLNANVAKFFSGFNVSKAEEGRHKFYTLDRSTPIPPVVPLTEGVTDSVRTLLSPISRAPGEALNIDTRALELSFGSVRGFQATYEIDTVVEDNVIKDDEVLGKFIDKAFKEKPEGSAEDIIAVVKGEIEKDVQVDIATWKPETKEVAIDQPAEILAYTKVATKFIPNTVEEMEVDRIINYKNTIKNLCDKVESYKKRMTGLLYQGSDYNRVGFEQQYALLLNQLSINCCAAEKIEILLDEIQKRKQEVLAQKVLSKFVEKHPGLEHKAGVKSGGTFVIVYRGKSEQPQKIPSFTNVGTLATNPFLGSNISSIRRNVISPIPFVANTPISSVVGFNPSLATAQRNIVGINPTLSSLDFLNANIGRFSDLILPPISNVAENTVVADFALPYNCCSDCAPVAFIVPKQTVSLRLPVDFICLDDETTAVAFEVVPADGIVAATLDDDSITEDGVEQIDGQFFFDATKMDDQLLGKEIKFTVNGQFTEAKVVVFRKPEFNFTMTEPRYSDNNREALVNFTVQGDDLPAGVTYSWEFGDNTLPDNRTDENPKHEYQLPVNDENKVTVTLTVTNGKCSNSVSQEIQFIAVDDRECIDRAIATIDKGGEELLIYRDIPRELFNSVLAPTLELYKEVNQDVEAFIEGKFNEDLNTVFQPMFLETGTNIIKRDSQQDGFEFFALANIYRLQVQLFYSIIGCQKSEQIDTSDGINQVIATISESLNSFNKNPRNPINIDKNDKLKEFLNGLLDRIGDSETLRKNIKIQLELLKF